MYVFSWTLASVTCNKVANYVIFNLSMTVLSCFCIVSQV